MEPTNQSAERAPCSTPPVAVRYEPLPLEYGERAVERRERLGGAASAAERLPSAVERQSQPPVPVTQSVLPAPQADDASAPAATVATDTPLVAADEDVIEKEWVDKVKQILSDTKDDPYQREQAVKKLQVEYVRKRYGREIGDSGD